MRVLVLIGLIAVAVVDWRIRTALLMALAAVLIAVLPLAATRPIERFTRLGHGDGCWPASCW